MIHESRFWKAPLLRTATWLENLQLTNTSSERALVRIERELFIGFYAIRKLLETFTVSLNTKSLKFQLQWSPCMERVDNLNASRISHLFKLEQVQYEQRDLEFLCNQFIHSFVFATVENDDGWPAGFFISSDRSCQRKVYFIELSQVLHAFRTVGRDYPASIQLRRNEKTQQWEHLPDEPRGLP